MTNTPHSRSDTIIAIVIGYKELMAGSEIEYDRRHIVLDAALAGIGIDPDTLPDTCQARITVLESM